MSLSAVTTFTVTLTNVLHILYPLAQNMSDAGEDGLMRDASRLCEIVENWREDAHRYGESVSWTDEDEDEYLASAEDETLALLASCDHPLSPFDVEPLSDDDGYEPTADDLRALADEDERLHVVYEMADEMADEMWATEPCDGTWLCPCEDHRAYGAFSE